MANEEHLAILRSGVQKWNAWREVNPRVRPSLSGANLAGETLSCAPMTWEDFQELDFLKRDRLEEYMRDQFGIDVTEAQLRGIDLHEADFRGANLLGTLLIGADLRGANLQEARLGGRGVAPPHPGVLPPALMPAEPSANLLRADLRGADLRGAHLRGVDLRGADSNVRFVRGVPGPDLRDAILSGLNLSSLDLRGALLDGADLSQTDLSRTSLANAHLTGAILRGADLREANLVDADLRGADLTGCAVFGVAAWGLRLDDAKQDDLVITAPVHYRSILQGLLPEDPVANRSMLASGFRHGVTVDNIEVAQFVHLLLYNEKIRNVLDTIGKKCVLILGRFGERKQILDKLRARLRELGFVPMVFDFEKPASKDFTETVRTLAGMSAFILADITAPKSVPQEAQVAIPEYMVPFVPIIETGEKPWAMFQDLWIKYRDWVFEPLEYRSIDDLIPRLRSAVVQPALERRRELLARRAETMRRHSLDDFDLDED
jgi:uncharacterized protein YjbI with pentapeptide repeats